ncbi:MAG: helix-turn-helix domain-containing protein [Phycisphaerae bacterium]
MPGSTPLYRPKFSRLQPVAARELVRQRRMPHSLVQRARLVLLLAQDPVISNPEAGRRLGMHENTIRYWRYRWATEGFVLEDCPRQGRPKQGCFFPGMLCLGRAVLHC